MLLRERAEKVLNENKAKQEDVSADEMRRIMHELRVYQIELEIQNEELRNTQIELELSKTKYIHLYDQAPVGYLTLSSSTMVLQANHTFLEMVGKNLETVVKRSFTEFIAVDDITIFLSRYNSFFKNPVGKSIVVRMVKSDNEIFVVSLTGSIGLTEIFDKHHPSEQQSKLFLIATDITQQYYSEQKLKQSEEKLRLVADLSPDLIFQTDLLGKITFVSPSLLTILQYNVYEVFNSHISKFVVEDNLTIMQETIVSLLKGNDVRLVELELYRKDKTKVWVELNASPIIMNSSIAGIQGIARDISERNQAIEQNKKLSRVVENSPVSIIITNTLGEIEYVNPKFSNLTGYTANEVFGKNASIVKSGKMQNEFYVQLWNQLNAGEEWKGEILNKRKNGEYFWEFATISPLKNNVGQNTHFIAIKEDITEKKLKEADLISNINRLKILMEIMDCEIESENEFLDFALDKSIQLTDSKIGYIYYFDEATNLFTLNTWSNGVMDVCSIVEPKTQYKLETTGIWGEAVRQRRPILFNDFQAYHTLKKGYPEGHAELYKYLTLPIIINNKIEAVVAVANRETDYDDSHVLELNILMNTAWKKLEKKRTDRLVLNKNKELTDLHVQKDRFLSILAHDMRGPFNAILGFVDLLHKNYSKLSDEKKISFIGSLHLASNHVFDLLESLLEYSRAQQNKISYRPSLLELNVIVNEVISLMQQCADNKEITLLSELSDKIFINADMYMIQSILRNLINNAIKFSNPKGTVLIGAEIVANNVQISVSDFGVGMEKNQIEKLFHIDSQMSTRGTNDEKGTGLGLLITKEFVDKHGGKIRVESNVGVGTTFNILLPIG